LGVGSEAKAKKIDAKFFTVGSEAKDANDYATCDKQKGFLMYARMDQAATAALLIAKMSRYLKMARYDVFVVKAVSGAMN
jgi:hypothetical protein